MSKSQNGQFGQTLMLGKVLWKFDIFGENQNLVKDRTFG